jgi:hypothetical protein
MMKKYLIKKGFHLERLVDRRLLVIAVIAVVVVVDAGVVDVVGFCIGPLVDLGGVVGDEAIAQTGVEVGTEIQSTCVGSNPRQVLENFTWGFFHS